jgi:hypothetical protein
MSEQVEKDTHTALVDGAMEHVVDAELRVLEAKGEMAGPPRTSRGTGNRTGGPCHR